MLNWQLRKNSSEVLTYEQFKLPFITSIEKLLLQIRNYNYAYYPAFKRLTPENVLKYVTKILRELIYNCIAHQNYYISARINVIEYDNRVEFINEGDFIPQDIRKLLDDPSYIAPYYRNPTLANAMIQLNMIDAEGMGIRRCYNILKDRYFPLLDYDTSEQNRTKVTLWGEIIDENYSTLLFENKSINIHDAFLLDKVQKKTEDK